MRLKNEYDDSADINNSDFGEDFESSLEIPKSPALDKKFSDDDNEEYYKSDENEEKENYNNKDNYDDIKIPNVTNDIDLDPADIKLIVKHTGCSVELAEEMLQQYGGDIVSASEAVMEILKSIEEEDKMFENTKEKENDDKYMELSDRKSRKTSSKTSSRVSELQNDDSDKDNYEYKSEEIDVEYPLEEENDEEEDSRYYNVEYEYNENVGYTNKIKSNRSSKVSRHSKLNPNYNSETDYSPVVTDKKHYNRSSKLPPLTNIITEEDTRYPESNVIAQHSPIPLDKLKKDPYEIFKRDFVESSRTLLSQRDLLKEKKEKKEKQIESPYRSPHLLKLYGNGEDKPIKSIQFASPKSSPKKVKQSKSEKMLPSKRKLMDSYKEVTLKIAQQENI